jgi:hypothetical protein
MPVKKPEFDSARPLPLAVVRPQPTPRAPVRRFRRPSEQTLVAQPLTYLDVHVDGRETSYFEWLGAGLYSADRRSNAQNARSQVLHELHYGFSEHFLYLRVDAFPESFPGLKDSEFRITVRGSEELRLMVLIDQGKLVGCLLDTNDVCILGPHALVEVAFGRILEVAIGRRLFRLPGQTSLMLDVALWRDGLLVDSLPAGISLEVKLGTDAFAWPAQ